MSRYTGPRLKILRALGVDLPGLSRKTMQDRPNPPGQHGLKQKRKSDCKRARYLPSFCAIFAMLVIFAACK